MNPKDAVKYWQIFKVCRTVTEEHMMIVSLKNITYITIDNLKIHLLEIHSMNIEGLDLGDKED